MTISEFIKARLAEREKAALKAAWDPVGAMEAHFKGEALHEEQDWSLYPERRTEYSRGQADALHWAATRTREQIKPLTLHDPERELRDVEAKLLILDDHRACEEWNEQARENRDGVREICVTLRALAAIDAGHPDYEAAWAPNPT